MEAASAPLHLVTSPFRGRIRRRIGAQPRFQRVDIAPLRADHSRWEQQTALSSTGSFGPYRVLEPLGQGGMGVVYRARHVASERPVAIKTVSIVAPRWIESLRREVDALTRIRHPGIVRIVDHGVHEGRPWYAMDLLEGESLRDFGARIWSPFRRQSMPPKRFQTMTATAPVSEPEVDPTALAPIYPKEPSQGVGQPPVAAGELSQVLGIVRRMSATLAFLHGEGFVNCDLKPENVLLVDGVPVLIDFGLSTRFPAASGREAIDAQQSNAGTLLYMSPEQLRGELVDARSDLYAMGCILYELLTGEAPFGGAPHTIRQQHLSITPVAPSRLVLDVPEQLDMVVLRLLAKSPVDRLGFADDLAHALAKVSGAPNPLRDFPAPRPYLYRPRFVGREDAVATFTKLRDQVVRGQGALALVGGESGVGKTRLALELMGSAAAAGFRVLAGESVALSVGQAAKSVSPPLHAIRPLLRSIADRCQEGGAEATERLLGHRRSVLALYEPLLVDVPTDSEPAPIASLGPSESRQRLLRYLAQSLAAFAQERPIFWVLEDLGWADDLSLAFLQSLPSEYFDDAPLLILGTYRTEEVSDAVVALSHKPHVIGLELPRLGHREVIQMVADMLAMPTQRGGFAAYVSRAAEGNPFFVTEHVRTAVSQSLFYRDEQHNWQTRNITQDGLADFQQLPLPQSLRELLEQRLHALSHHARETAVAAAVLGRESTIELVAEVANLSSEAGRAAIDELLRRHILEQKGPARVRFVHDKLREVAYDAESQRLAEFHARAAVALERRSHDTGRAPGGVATLAHHFAAAGRYSQAVEYFRLAGDQARNSFASADAIVLYRRALRLVQQHLLEPDRDSSSQRATLLQVGEALGDVLALRGQREEAREEYNQALTHVASEDGVSIARLHRKAGKTFEVEHRHEDAMRLYRLGNTALSNGLPPEGGAAVQEWLETCLSQLWVHYWLAQSEEMDRLVQALAPIAEQHGTVQQRAGLCQCQIFHRLRRDRYNISSDTLTLAEAVLAVCGGEGAPNRPWAYFQRGFVFVCLARIDDAEADLAAALRIADRAGDVVNQARAAMYLAVVARMRADELEVVDRSTQAVKLARDADLREYVACAKAMDAWTLLRRGDVDGALHASEEAMAAWATYGGVFPFHRLALVPRLEAQLSKDDLSAAVDSCRGLLQKDQQQLPHRVEVPLAEAVESWESRNSSATRLLITAAVKALDEHHLR